MKHTPGPWEWQFEDDATMLRSIETDDLVMAEYFGTGHPETFMPDGKNADLIAAAPDMYEALKAIHKYLQALGSVDSLIKNNLYQKHEELVRKTLVRAEGREG